MKKCKIAALLLSALMIVAALCGCGGLGKAKVTKTSDETVQIGIIAQGYGDTWIYKMCEAFTKKTGIDAQVVKNTSTDDWIEAQMQGGPSINDLDLIFDINEYRMKNLATKDYAKGYDRCYADLSDIYDRVPEGYGTDKTLRELLNPFCVRTSTWGGGESGFGDGKQYFANYLSSHQGMIYNAALFEKYKLQLPKTTNEMFELFDKIKSLNPKTDGGETVYPYIYAGGKVGYSQITATVWCAQYDGIDGWIRMYQGKDAAGNYSPESMKTPGRLSAYRIVAKIDDADGGYVAPYTYALAFTDAQVHFLSGEAFMMANGDWLEREMATNFSENTDVRFMRVPVNSDIINVLDTVKTEQQLRECVSYIDGDGDKPSYISEADLTRLTEARATNYGQGNSFVGYIPSYSNNIEAAKDFLMFMYSKEGQEIMLENTGGNMAALSVDPTQFDAYKNLSTLQKSKLEMVGSELGVEYIGNDLSHPMGYTGAVSWFCNPAVDLTFGCVKNSDTYMTPDQLWEKHYQDKLTDWDLKMSNAGVSN